MIKVSKKIFLTFVSKHKILFSLICVIQIVSLFASLFVYSFFVSDAKVRKEFDYSRTFKVIFDETISNSDLINSIETFKSKCNKALEQLFIEDRDMNISFDLMYFPNNVLYGRYFTENEFTKNNDVIIASKDIDEGIIVGDTINVDDKDYIVVGTNYNRTNTLPISALNKITHNNRSVVFIFKEYLEVKAYNEIFELLNKSFETGYVEPPPRVEDSNILVNDLISVIYIGLFLISLLNVVFVYNYILEENKELIYVFRINGASKRQCLWAFASVMFFIALILLILGCIITRLLLPVIIDFVAFDNLVYALETVHYFNIIIIFLIVVISVFIPFILNSIKKVSISKQNESG